MIKLSLISNHQRTEVYAFYTWKYPRLLEELGFKKKTADFLIASTDKPEYRYA